MFFRENEVLHRRYRLTRVLGDGGFGIVWQAEDQVLFRKVAIKRLLCSNPLPAASSSAFDMSKKEAIQEARKIAKFSHANIIQVYDVIEEEGEELIVMEYAAGGSLLSVLRERLKHRKWLETREAVDLLKGILSGLAAAHGYSEGSIIHQDLKPANIMLVEMQPKIADFGLAAVGAVERLSTMDRRVGLGHAGSPYYMSPEQLRGDKLDGRSDLFNLGLLSFLLLGMRHPFTDEAFLFPYREMVLDGIRPLPGMNARPLTTKAFQPWVSQLLDVAPEKRFASAAEALLEFEACEVGWTRSLLQAVLDMAEALNQGEGAPASLFPGEVVEAISQCRKTGFYLQAVQLFERGGFDLSGLPSQLQARAEEDYGFCKRHYRQETA